MSIIDLTEWLRTPQGAYVAEWEQARHDHLVADLFGFNALQLGMCQRDLLRANRMPLRLCCGPGAGLGCRLDPEYLPFANTSIDLVILPHVLEFAANPHQILREVERVLVPEGQVIISGFNPLSLWGAHRVLARHRGNYPWSGSYMSVRRIKDWLNLLGFELQLGSYGCYAPAVTHEKWLRRWQFIESAGDRWWPFAGAVYVVQAVKRVQGMRLITPSWRERKARAKALAPVTQKVRREQ